MSGASFIKYLAFVLMTLFALLGGLFAVGYAIEDPGGWRAALLVSSYMVPAAILCVVALVRPEPAGPILIALTALMVLFNDVDAIARFIPRDSWGPVGAVGALMLSAAIGFLGVHRPTLAGVLLMVVALGQMVAALTQGLGHGEGVPLRAALGGSTGIVVVPLILIGVLFLVAGRWAGGSAPVPVTR